MKLHLVDKSRVREYGKVRFRCRLQRDVVKFFTTRMFKISRASRMALVDFIKGVKAGRIRLDERSRFLKRPDKGDKIERSIMLSCDLKDWIEKVAFSERISQNEVLRMALEWWMETRDRLVREDVFLAAYRKWHHRAIKDRIEEFFFSFWHYARERFTAFASLEDAIEGTFDSKPPNLSRFYIDGARIP